MAWYNPWSKTGEQDKAPAHAQAQAPSQSPQPSRPPPQAGPSSAPTATSTTPSQAKSAGHAPHNALETSPELFQTPPSLQTLESPRTFISHMSPTLPLAAFGLGGVSGFFSSASRASLVFLAENAHRKPTTMQGWYFYNKTKNYRVLWGATKGGFKQGLRLGGWSSLFALLEGTSLYYRTINDPEADHPPAEYTALTRLAHWTDGMIAGQGTALAASVVYRSSPFRFLVLGTFAGTITGLLQDIRDELVWREQRKESGDEVDATVQGT